MCGYCVGNLWVLNFASDILFEHRSQDLIDWVLVDEEEEEMYLWKRKWDGKVYYGFAIHT